jgi:fimbrial chaperone protein
MRRPSFLFGSLIALFAAMTAPMDPVAAQGFAALVSPPRFELRAKPGERQRQVLELTNGGQSPARYRFRTADWALGADGQIIVHEEMQPKSCRPWVAIERSVVEVPAGGRLRYRFEVAPPAEAAAGECRFAVLIEGDDPAVASGEGFQLPVKGRIAIVVYVAVGEAAPKLEIEKTGWMQQNGQRVPALFVRNTGNAHGRVTGFLSGTDSAGRRLDFAPSSLPVLPGEVRAIALTSTNDRDEQVEPNGPVTIRGTLEWSGGRLPFEQRFD